MRFPNRSVSILPILGFGGVRPEEALARSPGRTKAPSVHHLTHLQIVTLGLDPRALHLPDVAQGQPPRVRPGGDDRVCWAFRCSSATYPPRQIPWHNPLIFRYTAALQRPVAGRCREGTSLSPSGSRAGRTWRATIVRDNRSCSKNRQPRGGYRLIFIYSEAKAASGSVRLVITALQAVLWRGPCSFAAHRLYRPCV